MLTLRDPQSSKTHAVPPAGSVIGREGGDADITVRTASVSKKHARVFAAEGAWFIEDLRSANGTFVDNEKISEPFQLNPGTVFDLAGYRFEVVSIEEEPETADDGSGRTFTGNSPAPVAETRPLPTIPTPAAPQGRPKLVPAGRPPPRTPAGRSPIGSARTAPKVVPTDRPTVESRTMSEDEAAEPPAAEVPAAPEPPVDESTATADEPAPREDRTAAESVDAAAAEAGAEAEAEAEGESGATREQEAVPPAAEESNAAASADDLKDPKAAAGKVLADLPKAIAYYMVAVPKLLFNPVGTIKKSVENQPFPGIDGLPLIAWALPGLATTFAVSLVCTLIVMIVGVVAGGGFAFGALVSSIIMVVAGPIIGGLVIAFLYHRVMAFILKLLKGQSDLKSRTNYLIFMQGVGVLGALPGGVAVLVTGLSIFLPVVLGAILGLVPLVLQLAATLISLGSLYVWLKYFQVHKIIPKIVAVLALLAVAGTLFNALGNIKTAIASITSGKPAVASVPSDVAKAATGDDDEASTDAKPLDPDLKKKIEDAKKLAAKGLADAEKAAAEAAKDGKPPAEDGDKGAKDPGKDGAKDVKEPAADPVKEPTKEPVKEPAKKPEPEPEPKKPVAAPTPAPDPEANPSAAPADSGDATPFQKWAAKRDFVEKAIAKDPTMLAKDAGLLKLYKQFHDKHREIRKKIGGKAGPAPDDLPALRMVEAQTFEQTGKVMDELYNRVRR